MQENTTTSREDNIGREWIQPVEDYLENQMFSVMELDRQISNFVTFEMDRDTGKLRTTCDWIGIGKWLTSEMKQAYDSKKISFGHPIRDIRLGIKARKRTEVDRQFYLKYIKSGKYQAEIVEICRGTNDRTEIITGISYYLKMLKNELEEGRDKC